MPIVLVPVTIAVWVCDFCGAHANHTSGSGAGLAAEFFIDVQGWRLIGDDTVTCGRCRLQPDVAHQLLTQAKAHTL